TGSYTVLASRFDAVDGTGQYSLTLAQAPGAFIVAAGHHGGPMTNGAYYQGSLLRGDLEQYSFQATAGDAISVSLSEVGTDTSFIPWVRVHAPNGSLVGNSTGALWGEADFTASL